MTDKPIAALRAILSGNAAENKRLIGQFEGESDRVAYSALVNAGFFEAVDRRFGTDSSPTSIVEYVADVRSRSDQVAERLNPVVAEKLIRRVLSGEDGDDIDPRTSSTGKLFLLGALVADENFSHEQLDKFLARVQKMADYLLSDG